MLESSTSDAAFFLKTCEMHTCGEPVRILESSRPHLKFPEKSNILEKRKYFSENYDYFRKMLILEPRGHADMFAVILTDPNENSGSNYGLLFLNNEGYAAMCGHATIAMGRYLLEKHLVNPTIPDTKISFDCPCGLVKVAVEWDGNKIGKTKFLSVPAFVQNYNYSIFVPNLGRTVKCDIVFGGNFYAIVSDKELGIDFSSDSPSKVVDLATFLFQTLKQHLMLDHPVFKELNYLYGIIVTDSNNERFVSQSFCVFGIKSFDRSPCGSGTTAIIASQYFRGDLKLKETKTTQNPFLGEHSHFQGTAIEEVIVKSSDKEIKCITVEICGRAYFTGECLMTFEEDDFFKFGFIV